MAILQADTNHVAGGLESNRPASNRPLSNLHLNPDESDDNHVGQEERNDAKTILNVIDHYSRRSIGFAVFKFRPTSEEVTAALDRIMVAEGVRPKHLIVDQGPEFKRAHFQDIWCESILFVVTQDRTASSVVIRCAAADSLRGIRCTSIHAKSRKTA